jgi:hypothetical protein
VQATEQLELLNENVDNRSSLDDTMDRLNQMIQQFENISTTTKPTGIGPIPEKNAACAHTYERI